MFMGGMTCSLFIVNILFFIVLFWSLVFFSRFFFKSLKFKYKFQYYECGFKNINKINIHISISNLLVMLFLIIYDLEFIFLYPILCNVFYLSLNCFFCLSLIFFILSWSIVLDNYLNSIGTQL